MKAGVMKRLSRADMPGNIQLNAGEINGPMPPAEGQGGFQDLIRKLHAHLEQETGKLTLDDDDRERIPGYAFDYGNGGYEERLKAVFEHTPGTGLGRPASDIDGQG